jgi:large subunit ribosomal protein L16
VHHDPPHQAWRKALDPRSSRTSRSRSKPLEVRQGKGKGNVEYWVAQIQPGKMLYEVQGVPEELAREAFQLAAAKIPVSTAFVKRSVM